MEGDSSSVAARWLNLSAEELDAGSGGESDAEEAGRGAGAGGGRGRVRLGLGAAAPKAAPVAETAVAKHLRRGKQRQEQAAEAQEGVEEESHGIDDDMEEGRAAATKRRTPRVPGMKVPVAPVRKSKKRKAPTGGAGADAAPVVFADEPAADEMKKEEKVDQGEPKPWKRQGGDGPEGYVRRRKKKRSKQKNIRKDNRPLEKRPEHLRPGANFTGRALTEETRLRLQKGSRNATVALKADAMRLGQALAEAGLPKPVQPEKPGADKRAKKALRRQQRRQKAAAAAAAATSE